MKKIITICLFELKRTFKKPSAYVLMLAMPLLFTLLFGSILGSDSEQKVKVSIVDEDHTELSKLLVDQLQQDKLIIYSIVSSKTADEQLKNQKVHAVYYLQKGFEEKMLSHRDPLILFKHQPNSTSAPLIKQMMKQNVSTLQLQLTAAQNWSKYSDDKWDVMLKRLLNLSQSKENKNQQLTSFSTKNHSTNHVLSGLSYSSAGFSIMFVMIMMLSVTGIIIEARKTGVWSRLFTTPSSRVQVMLGYFLSFFLIGWIQFILLMVSSSIFFGVKWGNPLGVFILITSLLLCVVGLGLAIASLVKTSEQQNAIGTLIIVSTCMLGGVYWPISIVPEFMQKMANFVPQSWAMKGFTELIAGGGSVSDIMTPVIVLIGFSLLFLSIGLSRVRYQ